MVDTSGLGRQARQMHRVQESVRGSCPQTRDYHASDVGLSTMFSRYYAEHTLGDEGVVQTEAELIPDWFAPLMASDHKSEALPLWRFILQPNRPPEAILEATSTAELHATKSG